MALKKRHVLLSQIADVVVNQNLLTVPFLTNRYIIAVLLLTYVRNSEKE